MNQSEYLNLSRKRKRTAKQISEEREKSLEKNTVYSGAFNRETREYDRGTKRNKLGKRRLAPTKRTETFIDKIANKLDEGYGSAGDFHKSNTKNFERDRKTKVGPYKGVPMRYLPKSMKHKGQSR